MPPLKKTPSLILRADDGFAAYFDEKRSSEWLRIVCRLCVFANRNAYTDRAPIIRFGDTHVMPVDIECLTEAFLTSANDFVVTLYGSIPSIEVWVGGGHAELSKRTMQRVTRSALPPESRFAAAGAPEDELSQFAVPLRDGDEEFNSFMLALFLCTSKAFGFEFAYGGASKTAMSGEFFDFAGDFLFRSATAEPFMKDGGFGPELRWHWKLRH